MGGIGRIQAITVGVRALAFILWQNGRSGRNEHEKESLQRK